MMRWIGFLIALALGAAGGLLYGWVIDPVKYVDTTPNSLRIDYKSDFVLMVAEIYQKDGNMPTAIRQLSLLGEEAPIEYVILALQFAEQHGYTESDILKIQNLHDALQYWNPILGTLAP